MFTQPGVGDEPHPMLILSREDTRHYRRLRLRQKLGYTPEDSSALPALTWPSRLLDFAKALHDFSRKIWKSTHDLFKHARGHLGRNGKANECTRMN